MAWMNRIIEIFNRVSDWFYSIYLVVYGWPHPLYLIADYFYNLCLLFNSLAWEFYYFLLWVNATAAKLLQILSWETIRSYIVSWFYYLGDLTTVFYYFWQNVTSVITNWWNSPTNPIRLFIQNAVKLLQSQINTLNTTLANLSASVQSWLAVIPSWNEVWSWFTDWWGKTLAKIIAWGALTASQILSLIDSAFTLREDFWEGWQDIRNTVFDFFTDPLDWLEDRFTNWFLGGE